MKQLKTLNLIIILDRAIGLPTRTGLNNDIHQYYQSSNCIMLQANRKFQDKYRKFLPYPRYNIISINKL